MAKHLYFKKRFHTNYRHFMRTKRLLLAKKNLGDPYLENTISEIAIELGFCDQSYFSNCFYKEFGIYPSEYRKKKMEEHNADIKNSTESD